MTRRLRIALACQQDLGGPPHPIPAYRFWRGFFADSCAEAGHTLLEASDCDWAAGLLPRSGSDHATWREITWERTLAWLRRTQAEEPIDFFLGYLYPQQILPAAIADIRTLGIPCVNFFCDNVREFRHVPPEFSGFNLHWVPEAGAVPLYRRAGLPHIHAPMPCWIPPSLRTPAHHENPEGVFIGTKDELRARLLADAFTLGASIHLYGTGWIAASAPNETATAPTTGFSLQHQLAYVRQHGWPALGRKVLSRLRPPPHFVHDFGDRAHRPLKADEYWRVTREASVCLGINRFPSPRHPLHRPAAYSRLRDIEAPMAGACYLTEWCEGIDHLYDPGTEIEIYRDATELVEKYQCLTADPVRRARLRAAGQRRALAEHTIPRTLDRLAHQLGLS